METCKNKECPGYLFLEEDGLYVTNQGDFTALPCSYPAEFNFQARRVALLETIAKNLPTGDNPNP